MALDRRLIANIDWVLLAAVLLLLAIGTAMILSATHTGRSPDLYLKQAAAIGLGLAALVLVLSLDYRRLVDHAGVLYLLGLAALVAVLLLGPRIAGTRRWFVLGGFRLQPSELVKLAAALFLAKVLAESKKEIPGLRDLLAPGAAIGLLAVLIAAEPDLGTAFCLIPLFLSTAFLSGLRLRSIVGILLLLGMIAGLAWQFALKPYQKERVYVFLGFTQDPQGAGYQKEQSRIAVGSGWLLGKGYRNGSQSQLGYLPARHTDFVLSVLAEEMGFVGIAVVLSLYLLVLWRCFETALLARDRVGALLAAGLSTVLSFQVVYNAAMVAGLVPVKGLPLPFMSYGGSSVLSSLLAIGLILNVRMRRFVN
jgi:rod shape determining protein RodA